jgi:hypothetical protein
MALAMLYSLTAAGQQPTELAVRSASVERLGDVFSLSAQLDFNLPAEARAEVAEGVVLSRFLEIVVHRARRFWLDETVATLEQRDELVFHALSGRYLIRNLNSEEQKSFPTLEAALAELHKVNGLPILDTSLVRPDKEYEVTVRSKIDVQTMPNALRLIMFWADDWRQRSDWYTCPLQR